MACGLHTIQYQQHPVRLFLGMRGLALTKIAICYQLRYVEPNHREHGRRWSERQVGVYHQRRDESNILILLHALPASRLQARLEEPCYSEAKDVCTISSHRPLNIHVIIISTYIDEWRWYLDDIGRACADLASLGLISAQSNADKSQEDAGLTTDLRSPDAYSMSFATLQVVRNMELKLLAAIAVLKATMETLDGLVKIAEEVYQASSQNSAPGQKCPDIAALQDLRRRASLFHLGADHVKCRTERLVDLVKQHHLNRKNFVDEMTAHRWL